MTLRDIWCILYMQQKQMAVGIGLPWGDFSLQVILPHSGVNPFAWNKTQEGLLHEFLLLGTDLFVPELLSSPFRLTFSSSYSSKHRFIPRGQMIKHRIIKYHFIVQVWVSLLSLFVILSFFQVSWWALHHATRWKILINVYTKVRMATVKADYWPAIISSLAPLDIPHYACNFPLSKASGLRLNRCGFIVHRS